MAKTLKKADTPAKTPEVKTPVAVEAAKTLENKPAAVKEAKTAAKAPKAKASAAKKTVKKPAVKKAPKAAVPTTKVFVEYQGRQMDMDAILEAVKAATGKKRFKSLEVYVKPEDGAAYYVVNGKDGGKADL